MDSGETGSCHFTCSPHLPTYPDCTGAEQGRVLLPEEVEGVGGGGDCSYTHILTMLVLNEVECSPQRGWVEEG